MKSRVEADLSRPPLPSVPSPVLKPRNALEQPKSKRKRNVVVSRRARIVPSRWKGRRTIESSLRTGLSLEAWTLELSL